MLTDFRTRASSGTRLPPIGLDASTPAGAAKALAIGAGECLNAAMRLDCGYPDQTGEYIVTFHAIELGLKAYLVNRGVPEADLARKPYGHNLGALFDEAKQRGLSVQTTNADEMIAWINEWHCDGVKIRYEFRTERTLPMCQILFPLAAEIIAATGMMPNP